MHFEGRAKGANVGPWHANFGKPRAGGSEKTKEKKAVAEIERKARRPSIELWSVHAGRQRRPFSRWKTLNERARACSPVMTKDPTHDRKPARKELKGKDPTRTMYANCRTEKRRLRRGGPCYSANGQSRFRGVRLGARRNKSRHPRVARGPPDSRRAPERHRWPPCRP